MKKIQMVDLGTQYLRIKPEIDQAIREVIDSCAFINGPAVHAFQKALEGYLGTRNVIPCANGTDALQVSMMALGLKPGDEVITTPFTFISTVEVIALLHLTPVLADVLPDTFTIDPDAIRKAVTPKTRAIVPVHLFGQCADMEEILGIAEEHRLPVIEDNAQAIGAEYLFRDGTRKKAGTIGDIGTLSFFPSKNLACYGDGGAVYTDDDRIAAKVRSIVNHGMTVRYYHDHIGINSRLDSIQAAILNVKLKHLDEFIRSRQQAAGYYDSLLSGHPKLKVPARNPRSTHVFHQYTLITKDTDRDALTAYMSAKGIPVAVYYPVPLHLQKAFLDTRYRQGDFPVAESLSQSVISLPMHSELDPEQQDFIAESLLEFLNRS